MKANELRIGNLVKHKNHEKPFKVFIIDTTETSFSTNIEPILLTEEWLVKLGFKYFWDTNIYAIDNFFIEKEPDNKIAVMYDYLNKSVEYVHQLQNLYFALTGEELVCQ